MKNIIYIVNIGNPLWAEYCLKSWKQWADLNDVEVVVLEENVSQIEPHWYKIYPFVFLGAEGIQYDHIAVVDNDTMIHPDCPNFFYMVPRDKIGVVVDDSNYDWIIRSIDAYKKEVFSDLPDFDIFDYFNSGFVVLSYKHEELYNNVIKEFIEHRLDYNNVQKKYGVGRDQTPLNFLLRKYGAKFHYLSKKFNLQNLPSKEILDPKVLTKVGWIFHYNSTPREVRHQLMKNLWDYEGFNQNS